MAGGTIKRGDQVKLMSGKDKGRSGKVIKVDYSKGRVYVEGVNMVKKAIKPRSQQEKGGIISVEASIHISNVMVLSKGTPSRVGFRIGNDGKKIRYAKKTGETL